jgi:prepilin-type N-terminal cleavage/methylation domain-containing protein
MCTIERDCRRNPAVDAGFTLIELLIGLSLALCLALGVAPLWVSSQSVGVREADETVWTLQGRVAGARLERDLRVAGSQGSSFPVSGAVLQATSTQVVFLFAALGEASPTLVEWELVGGTLMRRWGPCPATRPNTFNHSLYSDNKTMLENLDTSRSTFSYWVAGLAVAPPVTTTDVPLVDGVRLELVPKLDRRGATLEDAPGEDVAGVVTICGRVGR